MIRYRGLVSSDWSECLSPNGPFDFMAYVFPEIAQDLEVIFHEYTSNQIALSQAMQRCTALLPEPIRVDQMDTYLDDCFEHYTNVSNLIEACLTNNILFMINTTGSMGFFQRAWHKKLLPPISGLSAHPSVAYPDSQNGPTLMLDLQEISDKPVNTFKLSQHFGIEPARIIVMGDSGGDGPHFQWAAQQGALSIASMAKPSLKQYCDQRQITIDHFFGISYKVGESKRDADERQVDFRDLFDVIKEKLG